MAVRMLPKHDTGVRFPSLAHCVMRYIKTAKGLKGKTCLLRLDLNVTNDEIKHSIRIDRAVDSIEFLLRKGCRVVVISHRGRPEIQKVQKNSAYRRKYSLAPSVRELQKRIKEKVYFLQDLTPRTWEKTLNGRPERVVVLENTRFFKGESSNSILFAKQLSMLGDLYVNDAFAISHRKQASICAIAKLLPSYVGIGLEKEIASLDMAVHTKQKPFVLIIGGAKISDKMGVVKRFYHRADAVLLGGGVANTFFAAQGIPIGTSLYEKRALRDARQWSLKEKIHLPVDVALHKGAILDMGPLAGETYRAIIRQARIVIWSGPMGYIEKQPYNRGTDEIISALLSSRATCVIGGGETTSAFKEYVKKHRKKIPSRIYLSTGGGAMLEYLAGEKLPGIVALSS